MSTFKYDEQTDLYSWEKFKNPDYITSDSKDTYKANEKFQPLGGRSYQSSPVRPESSTFSKIFQGLGFVTTAGAAAYAFGDVFANFGLSLYRDKFPYLFDDQGNLIHNSKSQAMRSDNLARKDIDQPGSLPNQGKQRSIPSYDKEIVKNTDTLLTVLKDAQGLQNHDMQMLVQELVQVSDATRYSAAAQGAIAQSLEIQNVIMSEMYGVQLEQYNALSSIHNVLDAKLIADVEMSGQLVDVLKDVVSAGNMNAKATFGVGEQTANVAHASLRTQDELDASKLTVKKLKWQTEENSFVDLEGRHAVHGSPLEIEAKKNATVAKYHSDYNNVGYDDDFSAQWAGIPDLDEILTATSQSLRYSTYSQRGS